MIDELLHDLDRVLRGPVRVKHRLLADAGAGLADAVEAYTDAGLDTAEATRRAVADFGGVAAVAPVFQAELDVMRVRRTATVALLSLLVIGVLANLAWDLNPHREAGKAPAVLVLGVMLAGASVVAGVTALTVLALTYRASTVRAPARYVRALRLTSLSGAVLLAVALLTLVITTPPFLLWPPFLAVSLVALATTIFAGAGRAVAGASTAEPAGA